MYHRFNENKYPSTNIRNKIFIEHLNEINSSQIEFIAFKKFEKIINTNIDKNYLVDSNNDTLQDKQEKQKPKNSNKIKFVNY